MNSIKEILLEQLKSINHEKSWFTPAIYAVKNLNAEQAELPAGESGHTIREIVDHLVFWNKRYLDRFEGKTPSKMEGDNAATFTAAKERDWNETVDALSNVLIQWEKEVRESGEEKLDSSPSKDAAPWKILISYLTLHNAYHIGQIVQIRKEQGTWDAELGLKE